MFYTYVLRSKKDGLWYTGTTSDLSERFKRHNGGKVASTNNRRPFEIIYYEACLDKYDAYRREKFLKTGMGKRFLKNRLKRSLSLTGRGFTLIEILITLGLFILIAAFGIVVGLDMFRGDSFRSEQNIILSALQKARSRATANIRQSPHGVYFEPGKYILFEGLTFDPADPNNEEIDSDYALTITESGSETFEVVFEQLSGSSVSGNMAIDLSASAQSKTINIDSIGRIDY